MADRGERVEVAGRTLRLTHLEKVLYPATGTTKADVISYVSRISRYQLPHLRDRPVTRKRWPDGVDGPVFFAKAIERGAPEWIPRRTIEHSTGPKEYPLIEEEAALVYFAQIASLELHTPQWRFTAEGARRSPDRFVLDLDPGPGAGLAECAEVARLAREILSGVGLEALPVTSGSKGIHLYAPLDGTRPSADIAAFAREMARALESDHPDLATSRMVKTERPGKVFVDWSQNNAAKTTVAPYSLRGRERPTVAAPRTWEELGEENLSQLTMDEVLERAERDGDLLSPLIPVEDDPAPLARYLAKRDAGKTPEPVPDSPAASTEPIGHRFVIQEHHARRRHWDFRLEHDGVLVSWALPRGVPDTTATNHLGVMTEPHPMSYLTFSGDIPKGEYGAGHVEIWDTGTYTTEKWRDEEIIVILHGRSDGPLQRGGDPGGVRLALIRTRGEGEKSQWLVHRMAADTTPRERTPTIGASKKPTAPSDVRPGRIAPMLATLATLEQAERAARRWGQPHWAEFKWDGIRAIGSWDGTRLELRARSGTDITARYPELQESGLGEEAATVDGEIVALDAAGRPDFSRLQHRIHLTAAADIAAAARRTPVRFVLFDVLSHAGEDLTSAPLEERHRVLAELTEHAAPAIVLPPVADDVAAALATAREHGLEGIVVKNPRSVYRAGVRSENWLKVKLTLTQSVVIAGIRPGRGVRRGRIGSLLLGIPGPDGLEYVGRVGSGFSDRELDRLAKALEPLRAEDTPLIGVPAADAADARWVRPELVGEVAFAEVTPSGMLRQARWRGLRTEMTPADVHREA